MRPPRTVVTGLLAACIVVACTDVASVRNAHMSLPPASRDASSGMELAICPVDSTVMSDIAVIGAVGGVLSLGGNSISIPPGAVPQATAFQIVIPQSQYMTVEIHAVGVTSFLFQQPVSVTIDHSRCPRGSIPLGSSLQAAYIDSTGSVLQNMGGQDDSTTQQLTFSTGHLSGYAVAY